MVPWEKYEQYSISVVGFETKTLKPPKFINWKKHSCARKVDKKKNSMLF